LPAIGIDQPILDADLTHTARRIPAGFLLRMTKRSHLVAMSHLRCRKSHLLHRNITTRRNWRSSEHPVPDLAWTPKMKLFARLFSARRNQSMTSVFERRRLLASMPGEAGALAANRLGGLVH